MAGFNLTADLAVCVDGLTLSQDARLAGWNMACETANDITAIRRVSALMDHEFSKACQRGAVDPGFWAHAFDSLHLRRNALLHQLAFPASGQGQGAPGAFRA